MGSVALASCALLLGPSSATLATEPATLQVLGQAGVLGEWELTASVAPADPGDTQQLSGPLVMTHVGFCSVDGPEKKAGQIQLMLFGSSRIKATLVVEGTTCTYDGRKSDAYSGVLRCPARRDVPLLLWLK